MRRRRYPWLRRFAVFLLGLVILGTVAVMALVTTGTMKLYAIASAAMEPTLHCAKPARGCLAEGRDRIAVLTRWVDYGRGDIVTLEPSPKARAECGTGGTYVKRIVGLPGETVHIRLVEGEPRVFVDGKPLEETYVDFKRTRVGVGRRVRVPQNHYFVLGDHRRLACDSRHFGVVPDDRLIGKVVATFWPPGRIVFR